MTDLQNYRFALTQRVRAAFNIAGGRLAIAGAAANADIDPRTIELAQPAPAGEPSGFQVKQTGQNIAPFYPALSNFHFDEVELYNPELDIRYVFPHDPLVSFVRNKNITETPINGGPSVVEMSGNENYDIRIRGVCWNPEGPYPEDQVYDLRTIFEEDVSWQVTSRLFDIVGVTDVYLRSMAFPELEGVEDTQPFEIEARSVVPVELNLLEGE